MRCSCGTDAQVAQSDRLPKSPRPNLGPSRHPESHGPTRKRRTGLVDRARPLRSLEAGRAFRAGRAADATAAIAPASTPPFSTASSTPSASVMALCSTTSSMWVKEAPRNCVQELIEIIAGQSLSFVQQRSPAHQVLRVGNEPPARPLRYRVVDERAILRHLPGQVEGRCMWSMRPLRWRSNIRSVRLSVFGRRSNQGRSPSHRVMGVSRSSRSCCDRSRTTAAAKDLPVLPPSMRVSGVMRVEYSRSATPVAKPWMVPSGPATAPSLPETRRPRGPHRSDPHHRALGGGRDRGAVRPAAFRG